MIQTGLKMFGKGDKSLVQVFSFSKLTPFQMVAFSQIIHFEWTIFLLLDKIEDLDYFSVFMQCEGSCQT